MALTANEARVAYEELSRIAIDSGLKWLVDDVAVEISLGKQSLEKIKTGATHYVGGASLASKQKGKPAIFVITAEFSENEKLRLLVEAIEAVSCGSTIALTEVFNILSQSTAQNPAEITFAPDDETERRFSTSRSVFAQKDTAIQLLHLLQELKEAI